MGYEVRLHVIKPYKWYDYKPHQYGEELATIPLCKIGDGPLAQVLGDQGKGDKPFALNHFNPDRQQEAVNFFRKFSGDLAQLEYTKKLLDDIEDGPVTQDCYGSQMYGTPIEKAIEALEKELQKEEKNRRFVVALATLKAIRDNFKEDEIVVVAYGH